MPRKIIFVEDDMTIGTLITEALTMEGFDVTFLNTLEKVKEMIASIVPELLILDLEVGTRSSLDELPFIRAQFPLLPIIVASSHTDGEEVVACYENGINRYIKKPYDIKEISFHIRELTSKEQSILSPELILGKYKLDTNTHELFYEETLEKNLNLKEFLLLTTLLSKKGKVSTRQELLKEIWDNEFAEESLNNNITALRKYLAKDTSIVIQTIKKVGYRLIKQEV